jgi:hypothetical protein
MRCKGGVGRGRQGYKPPPKLVTDDNINKRINIYCKEYNQFDYYGQSKIMILIALLDVHAMRQARVSFNCHENCPF